MNKLTYKNITRFSLPVVIKSVDGSRSNSFNLAPQKTFVITEAQITGDVRVKTKNGLLKLVSQEVETGSTTIFPKVIVGAAKPVSSKRSSTKDVTITTKEKD